MPDVRLARDFDGQKAGDLARLTEAQYHEALRARAVAKVYREPVIPAKKSAAKKTAE